MTTMAPSSSLLQYVRYRNYFDSSSNELAMISYAVDNFQDFLEGADTKIALPSIEAQKLLDILIQNIGTQFGCHDDTPKTISTTCVVNPGADIGASSLIHIGEHNNLRNDEQY